ncbi:12287_t:CDS:2 [Ambispora gerdemannii]|uniref:12287_t:CDS:1 n=1 Tax=Ambispora gerdemannii TaxID=144530 RepID=A0A9N8WAW5_9GLOM|nr:12287_t:CDS:2 [Ambispora gerdemannii]
MVDITIEAMKPAFPASTPSLVSQEVFTSTPSSATSTGSLISKATDRIQNRSNNNDHTSSAFISQTTTLTPGNHHHNSNSINIINDNVDNLNHNHNDNSIQHHDNLTRTSSKIKRQLQQQVIISSSIDNNITLPAKITSYSTLMEPKTLILDLDETLIHSALGGSRAAAQMIEVMVDKHACLYYVHKRPHVDRFLKKVSEWYKVVIFTASMSEYADPVIDWLDPNKNLISNRYFRESCTNRSGAYVKDLTKVEPDLSKVCLIDNSPISYSLQQDNPIITENGIPIKEWINDPKDEALLDLLPFLDALRFTEDKRGLLEKNTASNRHSWLG